MINVTIKDITGDELESLLRCRAETTVTITDERSVTVSNSQYAKHRDAILAYCGGAEVEFNTGPRWAVVDAPKWSLVDEYRVAPRPKCGEVWTDGTTYFLMLKSGCWLNLTTSGEMLDPFVVKYSSKSLQQHMANMLLCDWGDRTDSMMDLVEEWAK